MEGGEGKESKSASEEIESQEQPSDESSTSRSFDCVFCKRGFSNAQALGGHMNIHRKERAQLRPESIPLAFGDPSEGPDSIRFTEYSLKGFMMRFPGSMPASMDVRANYDDDMKRPRPRELCLFGEEEKLGDRGEVEREKREEREEGDLDLELRLGHEP